MESAEAPAPCPTQEQAWKNAGMGHQNPCLGEGPVGVHCPDTRSFPDK
jgi:hypothetical protein